MKGEEERIRCVNIGKLRQYQITQVRIRRNRKQKCKGKVIQKENLKKFNM